MEEHKQNQYVTMILCLVFVCYFLVYIYDIFFIYYKWPVLYIFLSFIYEMYQKIYFVYAFYDYFSIQLFYQFAISSSIECMFINIFFCLCFLYYELCARAMCVHMSIQPFELYFYRHGFRQKGAAKMYRSFEDNFLYLMYTQNVVCFINFQL